MANQRNNNASTVNLSKQFIIWCAGKSVGAFNTYTEAKTFLYNCPRGSYIQYPMGAIRDHQIAKQRKAEFANNVSNEEWRELRSRQLENERKQRKADFVESLDPEAIARSALQCEKN